MNKHVGTTLDEFLAGEGILESAEAHAIKRVIAWQIEEAMKERRLSKSAMAKAMNTSRSQLDRLLDPDNEALTLTTLASAAQALGKHVEFRLVE